MGECAILVNGKELTENLDSNFYRYIQEYQYHKGNGIPHIDVSNTNANGYPSSNSIELDKGLGVYSYSFALYPEDFQPSGTTNFSRIDNQKLHLEISEELIDPIIQIFALNLNILNISNGMLGVEYNS